MSATHPDPVSLLKTCHIVTVNLGHMAKAEWDDIPEDVQIEALKLHWSNLAIFPNVKVTAKSK